MTTAAALAALLLAAPTAAPGRAGTVVHVTAARAYLDAGSDDGLGPGLELALRRQGGPAGRCKVEVVAPHHATCTGGRARPGDTFELPAAPSPAPVARPLPPPPPEEVLERRRALVEAATAPLVVYRAAPTPEVLPRVRALDLSLSYQTWSTSSRATSSEVALDVLARDVPITGWLSLDVDARVERWTSGRSTRFRPDTRTRLLLWQAQLTATPSPRLSVSAGRVLPWGVPGAALLDGGLAGWRGPALGGRAEAGLFAGANPEPDTLEPSSERYTAGGFWILDRRVGAALLRTEGRLAAVRSPELGTRGEASLTARVFLRRLDLSAEADLGAGGERQAPGGVDALRVDLTLRPRDDLRVGGSFRYAGLDWPQPFDPAAFPGRRREADGFASWTAVPWLRVGALAGLSEDTRSRQRHAWVGPELALPGILWGRGLVSAAYLEERGWLEGRSAWVQLVATPVPRWWLLARAGWSHQDGPVVEGQDEVNATLGARVALAPFATLRLTASGRTALDPGEGDRPSSLTALATLQVGF